VLLSRKSSQQSVGGADINGSGFVIDVDLEIANELDFDAGRPGSLKPGFKFAGGFTLETCGVGFLGKFSDGTRPGMEGSLNPVCDVSRGMLDSV